MIIIYLFIKEIKHIRPIHVSSEPHYIPNASVVRVVCGADGDVNETIS